MRELREELGVAVDAAERLMLYAVTYPGRTIWLDVWIVQHWDGVPAGLDAQALEWVAPQDLRGARHPRGGRADHRCAGAFALTRAARLPDRATSPANWER